VRIGAHRGAHGPDAPENSLRAFDRAAALGVDFVELDVRRTRDGALVLHHDEQAGEAPVRTLDRAELEQRAPAPPPLLDEALSVVAGRLDVNVELKEDGHVEPVLSTVQASGAPRDGLLVSSFLDRVVAQLARLAPDLAVGLVVEAGERGVEPDRAIGRAQACGATTLAMSMELAAEGLLGEAHAAGLTCVVWDAETDGELRRVVVDDRVSGVITDRCADALALRRSLAGTAAEPPPRRSEER
jgi:glycerophosphoryl diester phosphodiesterase